MLYHSQKSPQPGDTMSQSCDVCLDLKYSAQRAGKRLPHLGFTPGRGDVNVRYLKDIVASRECRVCVFILECLRYFELELASDDFVLLCMQENNETTILDPLSYSTVQVYAPLGKNPWICDGYFSIPLRS